MEISDPDLFLKVIESIVLNNIVYSIFNQEQNSTPENIEFRNNLNCFINKQIKEKEVSDYDLLDSNPHKICKESKNYLLKSKNQNKITKIKIKESESEKYNNIYNRIKECHNLNKTSPKTSIVDIMINNGLNLNENNHTNQTIDKNKIDINFSKNKLETGNDYYKESNELNLIGIIGEKLIDRNTFDLSNDLEIARLKEYIGNHKINLSENNNIESKSNRYLLTQIDSDKQVYNNNKNGFEINNFNFNYDPK